MNSKLVWVPVIMPIGKCLGVRNVSFFGKFFAYLLNGWYLRTRSNICNGKQSSIIDVCQGPKHACLSVGSIITTI